MQVFKDFINDPSSRTPSSVTQLTKLLLLPASNGGLTASQTGAFLCALRILDLDTKPEFIDAAACALRSMAVPVGSVANCVDIVGTGGNVFYMGIYPM